MGGGQGTRLLPLTSDRAKPAVPLGAKYRLIDIPLSNCINSGLNRVYILTQFNSTSLHRHIHQSYHFDRFSTGFVEILAAQQTPLITADTSWYEGTADAVRKNLVRLDETHSEEVLILSGDQIYQMDYRDVLADHRGKRDGRPSPVTIAALLVKKERARQLGIIEIDESRFIRRFVEKPGKDETLLASLEAPGALVESCGLRVEDGPWFLANMGIYVFERGILKKALDPPSLDFGREVLPTLLESTPMRAFLFHGYWEDIGTIPSFLEANLELASPLPSFNFYDSEQPVYTRARLLPASKMRNFSCRNSLVAEGSLVEDADIDRCLIGIRSWIGAGVRLKNTYVMGNDSYEAVDDGTGVPARSAKRVPPLGIGDNTVIENAIIDKNTRIGRNVSIRNESGHHEYEDGIVHVREGVVVVPRNGVVPDGYTI
jgi:glucose-1-phosphate adenylyltransferase